MRYIYTDVKEKEIHWEFTEIKISKMKNIFFANIINMNISVVIAHSSSKFWICIN